MRTLLWILTLGFLFRPRRRRIELNAGQMAAVTGSVGQLCHLQRRQLRREASRNLKTRQRIAVDRALMRAEKDTRRRGNAMWREAAARDKALRKARQAST